MFKLSPSFHSSFLPRFEGGAPQCPNGELDCGSTRGSRGNGLELLEDIRNGAFRGGGSSGLNERSDELDTIVVRGKKEKPCDAPLSSGVGSARAVLEAAALGADIATVGFAAGGVTAPAAIATRALGLIFEAGIGAVNAYDAVANGNYGPLAAQGASIGARLLPGGRVFQSGLQAVRGPTGILRNSAGQFRSSYLRNPAVKEIGDLATQKAAEGAVESAVCR